MALILNIDTAVDAASVCLAEDETPIHFVINNNQKDHASWLHTAIRDLLDASGYTIRNINALAITIGPGSYTGLRIGMATAKGLCYAAELPLIGINTLEMMAHALKDVEADFICPQIDARRMEIFTAVYDKKMNELIKPCAMIVGPDSFVGVLNKGKVVFTGNGSIKVEKMIDHPNAIFNNIVANATHLAPLSTQLYYKNAFIDLVYAEPFYIKEFYSAMR